jgi:plastocyanin
VQARPAPQALRDPVDGQGVIIRSAGTDVSWVIATDKRSLMYRFRLVSVVAVTAALALAATAGAMSNPKLTGTVGPGFTITLTSGGKAVKALKAGTYTIAVTDKSDIHNFHLTGPGLDKMITTVPFQGTKSITVTLKPGTYKYMCDPHASSMKGSFKVT